MAFFDLNIPFFDTSKSTTHKKKIRTKLAFKAMELGYSGIAYNRTIEGVMSDSDFCPISSLSFSSLLSLAPSLSSSVKFHRELLCVPVSSPFRQYRRLTVFVESAVQANALNLGNAVLKSYDLVAARPLNQSAFEQVCQVSEVDIIAIDFSEKFPFRLKLPMVKAAIQRGIYFEISYSSLIADVPTRRQVITSAKLLVDWTRGKNLIFSSAAPSVNKLRGPYDVANLVSLLGLSSEHAKASISRNCRTLIANALRKKQFHKEAIRVEALPAGEQCDSKELWSGDWVGWDPISSSEGDLLLDEIGKQFIASTKVSKRLKAIDFESLVDGFKVKDLVSGSEASSIKEGSVLTHEEVEKSKTDLIFMNNNGSMCQPNSTHLQSLDNCNDFVSGTAVQELSTTTSRVAQWSESDNSLLKDDSLTHLNLGNDDQVKLFSEHDTATGISGSDRFKTFTKTDEEDLKNSNVVDTHFVATEGEHCDLQDGEQNFASSCEPNMKGKDARPHTVIRDSECDPFGAVSDTLLRNCPAVSKGETNTGNEELRNVVLSDGLGQCCDNKLKNSDVLMAEVLEDTNTINQWELRNEVLLSEIRRPVESSTEIEDNLLEFPDEMEPTNVETPGEVEGSIASMLDNGHTKEAVVEDDQQDGNGQFNSSTGAGHTSGRSRGKRATPSRALLFPLKRLLNPVPFKRKAQKTKKIKMV